MTRFMQLQNAIGCKNGWLAAMLEVTPQHISRMRHGTKPMSRPIELVMIALSQGWRPPA